MMLKLLKSYNLLFLLIALMLLGSTSLYAQEGNAANFSIYGDVYSGVPAQSSLSDDWFQGYIQPAIGPKVKGGGNGMIDETETANFTSWTQTQRNGGFTTRSPYNQYKELNGFLLYDAVYGRDHVNFGSGTGGRDKSAFKGSSGKYMEDPQSAWVLGTDETVTNSVDLVDVYAHLRRQGVTVESSMWLMMGASTFSSNGDYYVDFELYAEPIALSADRTKFINSGPTNKGGHTEWIFDAAGKVTSSGDLLGGFKFSTNAVSDVELKIWVSRSTAANINPANFDFIPGSYHEGTKQYGYINILVPASAVKSTGVPLGGVTGPPWGTFKDQPGDKYVTTYDSGSFAEVALNLTSLGIDPSLATGNPCDAPFKKLLVKTKSSSSLNATLKDFAGPYNFLGASTVDVTIKKSEPVFNCSVSSIDLSPENPQPGAYYVWSTIDGLFSNGTKQVIGQYATAVKPGSYTLAAAPLIGCTQQTNTQRIYAAPCAFDDTAEVIENNGSVAINVLANDVDLDNDLDPTSVKNASLKLPDNGTVSINTTTGVITYTPNPDFYGIDTFEYRVFDKTPTGTPSYGPYNDVGLVTVNVLRDSDGDKVPDRDDLDDDNDGIPDTVEQGQTSSTPEDCAGSPNMKFNSAYTEVSGDGNNGTFLKGEIFEFTDILPGINSFVTIVDVVNASVRSLDVVGTYPNSFQPETNYTALTTGQRAYVEYKFEFKNSDGSLAIIPEFYVNFNDVDGQPTFRELNWTDLPESYTLNDPTEITITKEGNWLIGTSGNSSINGTSDAYPEINYSTKQINKSSYSIRVGLEATASTPAAFRQHHVQFSCTNNYTNPVIADLQYDFDGDGIPNYLDLDSDNDGIPDVLEAGLIDANNDGLVDTGSYGVNGLADIVETATDSGVINYIPINSDAATDISTNMYDFIDVDSDNDGITDTTEAFSNNPSYNDGDNNGQVDGFVDVVKNGWHDPLDAEATFPTPLNSDADSLPNYRDLDSDGDGLPDTLEGNFEVPDADNDGIVGTGIPADDDKDGLANTNDPDFPGNILGGSGFNKDRDNDGVLNYIDIDYDNDGIIDNTEAQSTFAYIAPTGNDTDGDGLDDAYDINNGGFAIGYVNTDGGWAPDYADVNSDSDAEYDLVENHLDNSIDVGKDNIINSTGAAGNDGMVDPNEPDTDGDGLADIFEIKPVDGGPFIPGDAANATNGGQTPLTQPDLENPGNDRDWREEVVNDNDGDGYSDLNDEDDDNDGILDIVEGGGDKDGDGVVFYLDADDNDSSNTNSLDPPNSLNDIDGDGLQNSFDLDSDGDGIPDHIEAGGTFDGDGNGTPGTGLLTTSDVNSVGVPLQVTAVGGYNGDGTDGLYPIDTDLDGLYNYLDLDSDNDGIGDVIEAGGVDPDGNGVYGAGSSNDIDADGLDDAVDILYNNDNPSTTSTDELGDVLGGTPLTVLIGGVHQVKDTDEDGYPDNLDLDSDDDTVPDNIEAQTTLGYIAYNSADINTNGLKDVYDVHQGGTGIIPVDTDGDGIPDYLDLDSDNEGAPDIVEANSVAVPNTGGRTNGVVGINGLDNDFDGPAGDTYTDPNGKHDNTQFDNFPDNDADVLTGGDVDFRDASFNDFDLDGIADNIDKDDDNDGVLDTAESYGADPLLDADGDGIPNYLDPQFCTGGALNSFGICPEFDLDNDGIPNHFDLDSDGDGCSDALEAGATTTVFTADYQFPVTPVGTDGVPDAVQGTSGVNSGNVDYTVIKTNGTVNDFMDAAISNACSADLKLVKTVNDATPKVGDVITFTLTLTNEGPFSVNQVQVKDIIPGGLTNISGTTSSGVYDPITGMWDLTGVILEPSDPGNVKTLQIKATVGPNCGTIDTIAEIFTSERFDPDSTPNSGD